MANEELSVSLSAPFQIGDHVAHVHLDDGRCINIVLRKGQYRGKVDGTPRRLFLTHLPPPEGEAELAADAPDEAGNPTGKPVSAAALYDAGVAIPDDGQLIMQLVWVTHCDGDPKIEQEGPSSRFAGFEHTITASLVGLTKDSVPLSFNGITADFDQLTRLDVGGKELTFGQIVGLAGDFYAHLDATAAQELDWAWPAMKGVWDWVAGDYRSTTLVSDTKEGVDAILASIAREEDLSASVLEGVVTDLSAASYPMRRYLSLAAQNYCHFACQPLGYSTTDNPAYKLYQAYHERAMTAAKAANGSQRALREALVVEAFGCHFLTDLFASGHIRTPRFVLGEQFGVIDGALARSLEMHAEDNKLGLWCTARVPGAGARMVWRAYGDGTLRIPEAKIHLALVQEAVRRSVAEVFAAFCEAEAPADERAADLIPVPLPPGEMPRASDALPDGRSLSSAYTTITPNHYPLYVVLEDGRVAQRRNGLSSNQYEVVRRSAFGTREMVTIQTTG